MPDIWMDRGANLSEVPVNKVPLVDDTDFVTIKNSIAYNESGMDLNWNFSTTAGSFTQTNVIPTTGGNYDWTNQGNGIYTIEVPASGGASINNDTNGFGWFTGVCNGVLAWTGPIIGFRSTKLNNVLVDGSDNLEVDIVEINGDTVPIDNLELDYNGTGYDKSNSTIGTLTTNNDKTGYALTSGERTSIADAILGRDLSAVSGAAARSLLSAARRLRNRVRIVAGTMTVYEEDDSTTDFTAVVTTAASDPVTEVDPT